MTDAIQNNMQKNVNIKQNASVDTADAGDDTARFVDLNNARTDEQLSVMNTIVAAQECPFCLENLRKYHKQPILLEGTYWLVTPNQWPYKNTRVHILFILKEHAEELQELSPEAGAELVTLASQLSDTYAAAGGGLAMRFGATRYSAGTVRHLHAQYIIPDADAPDFEPVRVKLGVKVNS